MDGGGGVQGKPGEGGRLEAKGGRCFRGRKCSTVPNDDHRTCQRSPVS